VYANATASAAATFVRLQVMFSLANLGIHHGFELWLSGTFGAQLVEAWPPGQLSSQHHQTEHIDYLLVGWVVQACT
jgi:hypothetical protein